MRIAVTGGTGYAWLLTSATPTDDSATLADLGVQRSSPTAAIVESLRA